MSQVKVEDLVYTIKNLGEKFKNFHLSVCICGAPMWQQPCSICGYYPQWSYDARNGITHNEKRNTCDKDRFCRAINKSGNILEFYLKSFNTCVDPQHDKQNAAREKSSNLVWPNPEEIWDYYTKDDINYDGKKKG